MKNIIQMIGLITLICFSFFYTEKVITVVNEQDPIMIKINELKDNYKIESTNAIIEGNTIIPGISGMEVNVTASYENMKQVGIFKEMLLEYNAIKPSISIEDNYDKYIIKGNSTKKEVAIVVLIDNEIDTFLEKTQKSNIIYNLFINYETLNNNLSKLKNNNYQIYPYEAQKDILALSNKLIEKNFNESSYCLTEEEDKNILEICKQEKMHTIIPTIDSKTNAYNTIKEKIENGSIIKITPNTKTLNELNNIINFIKSKGYDIVSLEELLRE